MRRWFRSLIVALLCLTLFVDTAKACWLLRHLRRSRSCRPVTCQPGCPQPRCLPCEPIDTACGSVVADHMAAASTEELAGHASPLTDTATPPAGGAKQDPAAAESVVKHDPTLVVGPQPSAAPRGKEPEPAAATPAAAPMPLEQAAPAVPETERLAAREPLPVLKPAQPGGPAMVEPASNDEPVTEPAPPADTPDNTAAPRDDANAGSAQPAAEKPMTAEPAPVADLVGGPETKPARRESQEPNLFDLYGDEVGDDEAIPAKQPAVPSDPDVDTAPATDDPDEPEMTPEDASQADTEASDEASPEDDAASEETDGNEEAEEMAEEEAAEEEAAVEAPDEAAENPPAEPAEEGGEATDERPDETPASTETDPSAAAFTVPDEPMRRWTDETGTRHAQGWLVELHADRVRILKVNGRHTTVPIESLSATDRDYVQAVAARLAAERDEQTPSTTTTAGL